MTRTLADWTAAHVTMKAQAIDSRPDAGADWTPGSHHYIVTLTYDGAALDTPYSMGPALTGGPEAVDVLDSLLSDASYEEEHGDVLDFAAELCYDLNDAKERARARAAWRAISEMAPRLRAWLGDAYEHVCRLDRP